MSLLTDFLKLFKWNTSDEADLEEEFDIDISMNENWDKLDANAKTVNQNISELQEAQTKQDTQIKELQDRLQQTQNALINETTEEATSLHVENAADLPARLEVRGNHKQETREGYNLVKLGPYNTSFSGIDFASNLDEGWISATGTSTGASAPIATVKLPAGDYVFSGGPENGSSNTQRLSIYKQNEQGTFDSVYSLYGSRTYTVNLTEETTFRLNYVIPGGTTVDDEKIYPMIVSGTETKPFQVYGSMPSIEYPSEIETVNSLKIIHCNSNFLEKQEEKTLTWNGLTATVESDGTIVLNGTVTQACYVQIMSELLLGNYNDTSNFKKNFFVPRSLSIYL